MAKDGHVTLHDVAARAGVSVATASRALTGVGVRKKNQSKVDKAAFELGYVANEAARALRSVRTMTVGVVFNRLNSPLSTELLDALAAGLDSQGYSVFVATAQDEEDRFDELVRRFLERRVDALLCVNAMGSGTALERFKAAGIPVATLFGKSGGYKHLPLIASSLSGAIKDCLARLRQLNHKRIAIVRPTWRSRPIESFRASARTAGFDVRVCDSDREVLDAESLLGSLLRVRGRPTAVIALQSDAVRILQAAEAMSVAVPDTLSVIGIRDRAQQAPITRLQMSMLHTNPGLLGAAVADMLGAVLGEVHGASLHRDRPVEIGTWIQGETTGPAQAAIRAKPWDGGRC